MPRWWLIRSVCRMNRSGKLRLEYFHVGLTRERPHRVGYIPSFSTAVLLGIGSEQRWVSSYFCRDTQPPLLRAQDLIQYSNSVGSRSQIGRVSSIIPYRQQGRCIGPIVVKARGPNAEQQRHRRQERMMLRPPEILASCHFFLWRRIEVRSGSMSAGNGIIPRRRRHHAFASQLILDLSPGSN